MFIFSTIVSPLRAVSKRGFYQFSKIYGTCTLNRLKKFYGNI